MLGTIFGKVIKLNPPLPGTEKPTNKCTSVNHQSLVDISVKSNVCTKACVCVYATNTEVEVLSAENFVALHLKCIQASKSLHQYVNYTCTVEISKPTQG